MATASNQPVNSGTDGAKGAGGARGAAAQQHRDRLRERSMRPRARGGMPVTVLSWLVFLVLASLAACVPLAHMGAGAPPVEGAYIVDIAANFGAHALLVTIFACIVWVFLRRKWFVMFSLLLCAGHVWMLAQGRAAIAPVGACDQRLTPEARASAGLIRIMHFNASREQTERGIVDDMKEWGADIVAITEPSSTLGGLERRLFDDPVMPGEERTPREKKTWTLSRDAYFAMNVPGGVITNTLVGEGYIASRWPMTPIQPLDWNDASRALLCGVVETPRGRFAVIALHPHSPRSEERWVMGNEIVAAAAKMVEQVRGMGLPVVVLGDMNSTPTGARSRAITATGLCRCKPLMRLEGTWPTKDGAELEWAGFWPLTIAIDDVFIERTWHVRGWSRGQDRGSDHWPVIVDLEPGELGEGTSAPMPSAPSP